MADSTLSEEAGMTGSEAGSHIYIDDAKFELLKDRT